MAYGYYLSRCRPKTFIAPLQRNPPKASSQQREVSLQEAIEQEKTLLNPFLGIADLTIDTSHLSQHQLCNLVRDRIARETPISLQLLFQSFGYKNGIPADADIIFDVRCLPNPYWDPTLRPLTGKEVAVVDLFAKQQPRCRTNDRRISFNSQRDGYHGLKQTIAVISRCVSDVQAAVIDRFTFVKNYLNAQTLFTKIPNCDIAI